MTSEVDTRGRGRCCLSERELETLAVPSCLRERPVASF